MALSGLEIYKLLPKTNCKDCGFPTCLAFAMKLATKQVELSACPHVSEEARAALEAASTPPIRLVSIGPAQRKVEVGNETVLFRHDKTFVHQPGLFVRVKDTQPEGEAAQLAGEVAQYEVERVGTKLRFEGLAIENASGEVEPFVRCISGIGCQNDLPLVLMSPNPLAIAAALDLVGGNRPLIYAASESNFEALVELAKKYNCPLAVRSEQADDLSALATLSEQITKLGVPDLVLDTGQRDIAGDLEAQTAIRRLAIRKSFRPLGFPTIFFAGDHAASPMDELAAASQAVCKYAGLIVLDNFDPSLAYPLLTLRQNIYTDPQKPIQVKPDVYPVNEPGEGAPVIVTTNFSLTYFTVIGEIEASGVPTWLLVADAEGMSVLTAWAAGKFDAEKIAKTVRNSGLADKLKQRRLILPGMVSSLLGETEELLPDWQVMVGPREAVDLPRLLKSGPKQG